MFIIYTIRTAFDASQLSPFKAYVVTLKGDVKSKPNTGWPFTVMVAVTSFAVGITCTDVSLLGTAEVKQAMFSHCENGLPDPIYFAVFSMSFFERPIGLAKCLDQSGSLG